MISFSSEFRPSHGGGLPLNLRAHWVAETPGERKMKELDESIERIVRSMKGAEKNIVFEMVCMACGKKPNDELFQTHVEPVIAHYGKPQ